LRSRSDTFLARRGHSRLLLGSFIMLSARLVEGLVRGPSATRRRSKILTLKSLLFAWPDRVFRNRTRCASRRCPTKLFAFATFPRFSVLGCGTRRSPFRPNRGRRSTGLNLLAKFAFFLSAFRISPAR